MSVAENRARGRVDENGRRGQVTLRGTLRGTRLERGRGRPAAPDDDPAVATAAVGCESVPSGADYLCSTYDMGISKAGWNTYKSQKGTYPLDQIGQHIYVDVASATTSSKLATHLQEIRNAYVRSEGAGTAKKIHVTEIGWETEDPSMTPELQAQNLRTAFETFKATRYVGRAFWFLVQDIWESGLYYGLVVDDYSLTNKASQKPAFTAYQTYARY